MDGRTATSSLFLISTPQPISGRGRAVEKREREREDRIRLHSAIRFLGQNASPAPPDDTDTTSAACGHAGPSSASCPS